METVGETTIATQGEPQVTGQTSEPAKGSTSTYTEEQVTQKVSDALTEQGRKHKTELESALKETQNKIKALEAELEEMSVDDPDRQKLKNRIREFETREAQFKEDKEAHDAEWNQKLARITEAEETNFEIALWDLCEEYDNGDAAKLKNACLKAKIADIDGARALAEVLWTKKENKAQPLVEGKPDSGVTTGGGVGWKEIRDAYIANPNDPTIRAAYLIERRKRGL